MWKVMGEEKSKDTSTSTNLSSATLVVAHAAADEAALRIPEISLAVVAPIAGDVCAVPVGWP